MKLYYAGPSPFAHKVLVAAHELGVADQVSVVDVVVSPVAQNETISAANPLAKIPTLVLDDGRALFDSRVIVDYLDSLTDRSLTPAKGPARWTALTEQAQADGVADACLLARYEAALRPEPLRWAEWQAGQMGKVRRGLDAFEGSDRRTGDDLTIGDIALACALRYLEYRFPLEDWRATRPMIAGFYDKIRQRAAWVAAEANP